MKKTDIIILKSNFGHRAHRPDSNGCRCQFSICSIFSINNPAGKDMTMSRRILAGEFPRISQWADSMEIDKNVEGYIHCREQCTPSCSLCACSQSYKNIRHSLFTDTHVMPIVFPSYRLYVSTIHSVIMSSFPDLHAHGRSGGNDIQMGWKDADDVMSWFARSR
jgi:hypothetical protein